MREEDEVKQDDTGCKQDMGVPEDLFGNQDGATCNRAYRLLE